MDLAAYHKFCAGLPAATHGVQWGGLDVWKVGGKVFAIAGVADGRFQCTFKVSETAFQILRAQPGLRPAPYLASRGMSWIQHHAGPGLSDGDLKAYLIESHRIVASGLTKTRRRELGLG